MGNGGWKEYYCYSFETSLAAGVVGSPVFTAVTIRTDSDADYEVNKRTHIATSSQILVRYQDDAYGRFLQNLDLDLRSVSGTILFTTGVVDVGITPNNFLPYILTRPFPIRASTNFTASYADESTAVNQIRQTFHGAKLRPGNAPWAQRWNAMAFFDYTIEIPMAANGSGVGNLAFNIDSHFMVRKLTGTRTGASLITIKDGASDRQWMDKPVHFDNLFGNSQFPNILPAPRFVYRGSVLNITATDISGLANTLRLTFSGEKLF